MIEESNVVELKMPASDYDAEREKIRATYGESSGEAGALRDQALAN
jgi:hypothetical protein